MAAYSAAKKGNSVTVLEKNEKAGKKIYITGKGRCNVTNDTCPEDFFENVVHNPKFLKGCIYNLSPEKMMRFLEEGGLALKTERGNRVFPLSDKASDVTKCLENYCRNEGVRFCFSENVLSVSKVGESFIVKTENKTYMSKSVVVATGGVSYPGTGSTGDGYKIAQSLGIKVVPPKPALCGICCDMKPLRELQGLSLKNVQLSAFNKEKKLIRSFFGEMLFTHYGISGPIVLSLSSVLNDIPLQSVRLQIDLKPALSEEILDQRILRDFDKHQNKQICHALRDLLPKNLILPILRQASILYTKPVNLVKREERAALVQALKGFGVRPLSLRPISEAIVTAGGVDVSEINPKDMQSKRVKGLYFCGELLDVDAFTGGYNLQIAFSTGYAAGSNI